MANTSNASSHYDSVRQFVFRLIFPGSDFFFADRNDCFSLTANFGQKLRIRCRLKPKEFPDRLDGTGDFKVLLGN